MCGAFSWRFDAENCAHEREVGSACDFDVGRVALDDVDRFAEAFDEGCIVGCAGKVRLGVGASEEIGLEDLGCLHFDEVGAIDGCLNGAGGDGWAGGFAEDGIGQCVFVFGDFGDFVADAFDGASDVDGGDDRGEGAGGCEDAIEQLGADAGASGIVDSDVGGVVGDVLEGVLDGFPAVDLAAGDELCAVEGEGWAVFVCEGVEVVGRAGDDDAADVVAFGECFDGAQEHGPAAEVLSEFVLSAEASADACCGNDHANVHGAMLMQLGACGERE